MKIGLKSTFNQSLTKFETQSTTLGALLKELSNNYQLSKVQFFDCERCELYPDCDVKVNGQSYSSLANGLDTRLKDGDEVEIILVTIAGG